ncbi:MAG TPA: hypothetical protein VNA20_05045 [Frankiaceae bacterium]|nr:hypothetical protein [Frankiaceae bacterium]
MTEADDSIRPAWKRGERRGEQPPPPPEPPAPPAPPAAEAAESDDDLERGRTLALVAALGRLQMSLDVVVRQQKRHHEEVDARLARIERVLAGGARLAPAPGQPGQAGTPAAPAAQGSPGAAPPQ